MWLGLQNRFDPASNIATRVIKVDAIYQEKSWRVFFSFGINSSYFSLLLFYTYYHPENRFTKFIFFKSSVHHSQYAILAGNQEYVPEPSNQEEKLWIFKSQVLIPYSTYVKTHALMGPMHDPLVDITILRYFFPSYHQTKPIVSTNEPINLEYMNATLLMFCSTPPPQNGTRIISHGCTKSKLKWVITGCLKDFMILFNYRGLVLLISKNMFFASLYF